MLGDHCGGLFVRPYRSLHDSSLEETVSCELVSEAPAGRSSRQPRGWGPQEKGLTGIFGRYKKGMTWSHSPQSWPFLRRTRPSLFWSRVQKFGQFLLRAAKS